MAVPVASPNTGEGTFPSTLGLAEAGLAEAAPAGLSGTADVAAASAGWGGGGRGAGDETGAGLSAQASRADCPARICAGSSESPAVESLHSTLVASCLASCRGPRQVDPAFADRADPCGGNSTDVRDASSVSVGIVGSSAGGGGGGTRGNGCSSGVGDAGAVSAAAAVRLWIAFSARSMACSAAAMTSPSLSESTSSLSQPPDGVARKES